MLRFLSPEWLGALDASLRSRNDLGARFASTPIALAQEVTRAGGERTRYVMVLDASGGRIDPSVESAADVTFVCDEHTAVALARGVLNAQAALASGSLKVRGEVDRLAAASAAVAGLGDVLAALRAETTF